MPKPLYLIRTDAVLIHPSLPGFPITHPPRMAATPDSPRARFITATALAPISWPGILAWYGLKQPQRHHVWPLRALLHIYLMVSLRHTVGEEPGASLQHIHAYPTESYSTLLGSGTHYVGNFWSRIPEMLLLALSKAKEPMVGTITHALMTTALAHDATHHWQASQDFSEQITRLVTQLQSALDAPDSAAALTLFGLTRRRAGVIERALINALRLASPDAATTHTLPMPTTLKNTANRLATEHSGTNKQTLGADPSRMVTSPATAGSTHHSLTTPESL